MRRHLSSSFAIGLGLLSIVACSEASLAPAEGCSGVWVVLQFKSPRPEGLENGTYKLRIENPANPAESDACEMTKTSNLAVGQCTRPVTSSFQAVATEPLPEQTNGEATSSGGTANPNAIRNAVDYSIFDFNTETPLLSGGTYLLEKDGEPIATGNLTLNYECGATCDCRWAEQIVAL